MTEKKKAKIFRILEEWQEDCSNRNEDDLAEESLRTAKLHSKYLGELTTSKLQLIELEANLKGLRRKKYEFYVAPDETHPKEWDELAPPGHRKLTPDERKLYVETDEHIIAINKTISVKNDEIDLLKTILKEIDQYRWAIKHAIDARRLNQGM